MKIYSVNFYSCGGDNIRKFKFMAYRKFVQKNKKKLILSKFYSKLFFIRINFHKNNQNPLF